MKKFKKSTAIVLSVLIGIIVAIGMVLSFVPIKSGAKTFVSLSGAMNVSSDITGGIYGEYQIKTENPTQKELVESMAIIKDVLDENGYKNINVYAVGKTKIRVEASYPTGDDSYSSVYTTLSNIASGAFSLRSTSSIEEKTIQLFGAEHVEEVKVFTNNDTKSLAVVFNDAGQERYKQICNATTSIYLVLGDYNQSISASGVTDYTQLVLSNTDWENLIALEQKIKIGCMKIELDADTVKINTMSASMSAGESNSNIFDSSFFTSTAYVVTFSALAAIIVLMLALFVAKFGFYAILIFITMLLNTFLFLAVMCLIPSVEFGLSTIMALSIGVAVIYSFAYNFASSVKTQYNLGKTLAASLEQSYKKQLPSLISSNVVLFVGSLVMFAFSFGELSSATLVFAACSFLSLLTNLFIVPFFIKVAISFDGFGTKLFMLKKRSAFAEIEDTKEAE